MPITKSQVEQVIKLARKAYSFPHITPSNMGDEIDEVLNPPKNEKWFAHQELKEYLMVFSHPQLIELAQLIPSMISYSHLVQ